MRQRSRENQQLMAQRIMERFDAVEVTGLRGWERERRLVKAGWYGELTETQGAGRSAPQPNEATTLPRATESNPLVSVSSVQPALFTQEEAA